MRSTILSVAIVGLVASFGQAAVAQTAYKSDDIVKAFAPDLGATRGLCIGTEAECAASAPKPKTNVTFDLMVNFDYNSDSLTKPARQNLDEFAKALRDPRLSVAEFAVEGHTDGSGGESYNLTLSERRAKAVVRYLGEKGVSSSKLVAKGYGEQKPRATDPLDPLNRRVETRLRVQ